ncbi:MAG: hypothetical protein FJ151_02325 [Euryarchaeota archaeon]|nr:hypothetical protein [Euryarchaeota archaeon]
MAVSAEDHLYELERAQTIIEYLLGVVVPALLALMLFSYVLLPDLFQAVFVIALIVSVSVIWPAKRMHDLHYLCWSRNTVPLKLVTSTFGMIYISTVSVFSVSMISVYEGLSPETPLTFGIVLALLIVLIVVLAYNSRYKERLLSTEKRFFRRDSMHIANLVLEYLDRKGEQFTRFPGNKGLRVTIAGNKLGIRVIPLGTDSSEVIVENIDLENVDMFNSIKEMLKARS